MRASGRACYCAKTKSIMGPCGLIDPGPGMVHKCTSVVIPFDPNTMGKVDHSVRLREIVNQHRIANCKHAPIQMHRACPVAVHHSACLVPLGTQTGRRYCNCAHAIGSAPALHSHLPGAYLQPVHEGT